MALVNYQGRSISVNADIGERGARHPVDDRLLPMLDRVNIAVGGHAGDHETVAYYLQHAQRLRLAVAAHISYPDKASFGRISLYQSAERFSNGFNYLDMLHEFDQQLQLMTYPALSEIKFHGALYNDCVSNAEVAKLCAEWLRSHHFTVITMPGQLSQIVTQQGGQVISEFFAERAYALDSNGGLILAPRTQANAVMQSVNEALAHVLYFLASGGVKINGRHYPVNADTVCIHSDSPIAVELLSALQTIEYAQVLACRQELGFDA